MTHTCIQQRHKISIALEEAQIILLLISADFLASDYVYDMEVRRAIAEHESGEVITVSGVVGPIDFRESPFGKNAGLTEGWSTDCLVIQLG